LIVAGVNDTYDLHQKRIELQLVIATICPDKRNRGSGPRVNALHAALEHADLSSQRVKDNSIFSDTLRYLPLQCGVAVGISYHEGILRVYLTGLDGSAFPGRSYISQSRPS